MADSNLSSDMPYPDEFKVILPDRYLIAVGKVCVQWAQLESVAEVTIQKIAGFDLEDNRGAIMTAHLPWTLRMDILESLISELQETYPHLARFDTAKPALKRAQAGRNRIVHGIWEVQQGKVLLLRATARGKLKTGVTPITVAEIDAITTDINKSIAALVKLILDK